MRRYTKQPESAVQLLNRQIARGLLVPNRDLALSYVDFVGAYRLKGFWLPLLDAQTHCFPPGTSFDTIVERYEFDRRLRQTAFDALGQLEVAIRSVTSNTLSAVYGAHWFLDRAVFDASFRHEELRANIEKSVKESKMPFITHYRNNYGDPPLPPSWATAECMTFGTWSRIFSNLSDTGVKRRISKSFKVDHVDVFANWLHCLSYLRNAIYHHDRVLGTSLVFRLKPLYSRQLIFANPNSFHAYATVIHYLTTSTKLPTSWKSDLQALFASYRGIDPRELGFEPSW